jgi:hypothetical protein
VFTELAYCWTAFIEDWIRDENCSVALLKAEVICFVTDESVCWPVLIALLIGVKFGFKNVDAKVSTRDLMS